VRGAVVDVSDDAFLGQPLESSASAEFDLALLGGALAVAVEVLERTMIRRALQSCGGNRAPAGRRLGIHRQLLYTKLRQLGIE
jgi:DNA-binding NtrC family response regulator